MKKILNILLVAIASMAVFIPLPKSHAGRGDGFVKPANIMALKALPETNLASVDGLQPTVVQNTAPAPTPVSTAPTPSVGVTNCGDNIYKQYIYMKESGCRTNAVNQIGACGIGQALPCSKMGCSLSDFACQDAWFSNYALVRYGSWANAYAYWLGHRNW